MTQEVLAPFLPQHKNAIPILERGLIETPNNIWWSCYHAGGIEHYQTQELTNRLKESAASLLLQLTGKKYEIPNLPY